MTPDQVRKRMAIVVLVAGVLCGFGTLLPWLTVSTGLFTISRNGIDSGSDAYLMLGCGALIAICGLVVLTGANHQAFIGSLIGGLVGIAIGILDYRDVKDRGTEIVDVTVGLGLYLCIGASIFAAGVSIGGLRAGREASTTPAPLNAPPPFPSATGWAPPPPPPPPPPPVG